MKTMKGIVVHPGEKNSVKLKEIKFPTLGSHQVLIKSLEIGIDGTDREINEGLYGEAPPNIDFLVLGHESLGLVVEVGKEVEKVHQGDLVVPTVRRPDDCIYCQQGYYDLCIKGNFIERGIKGKHGYLSEYFVEEPQYLIKIPSHLREIAVILEPLSVVEKGIRESWEMQLGRMPWQPKTAVVLGIGMIGILGGLVLQQKGIEVWFYSMEKASDSRVKKLVNAGFHYISAQSTNLNKLPQKISKNLDFILDATGNSSIAINAISIIGINGILCLTGVTGGDRKIEICSDCLNLGLVLGNKAIIGTVNANIQDFKQGLMHLETIHAQNSELIPQFLPEKIPFQDSAHVLQDIQKPHLLKSIIDFSRKEEIK